MTTEHAYDGKIYTLTNDGIAVGDEVFPISNGICRDGVYTHQRFDFRDFMSGFPDEPHTMLDLNHSPNYKPYECRTSHGFSPVERYFKIIETRPLNPSFQ